MTEQTPIYVTVASLLFGGGSLGVALVQWIKNRGVLQTRHSDELKQFRTDLQKELAEIKAEAKRDSKEKDRKIQQLDDDAKKQAKLVIGLQMQFAIYRERVRLLIKHFRSGSTEWKELAETLESDQNDVDFLLKPRIERKREVVPVIVHYPANMERILVIDDEEDTRNLVRIALEHEGYYVDVAHNALVGLEKHEAAQSAGKPYHLIILDYEMPDMDGEQVGRIIRISDKKTRIVFFTGHDPLDVPGLCDIEESVIWVKNNITAADICQKVREL